MNKQFWTNNICCIVTGASKGFGKEICLSLANRFLSINSINKNDFENKISFILSSRDCLLLDDLKKSINNLNQNINVIDLIKGPLEDKDTLKKFEISINGLIKQKFDHLILINNAGSLSDPNKLVSDYSTDDTDFLTNYLELNLLSFIKLTSVFIKAFSNSTRTTVVNVTSLLAIQPYKGLSLYGSVKAARDIFLKSIALEYPNVNVLNYAPGILKTNMANILKNEGFNKEIFNNDSNVLEPKISAKKLIYILENNLYKNGDHVDYYSIDFPK